MKGLVVTEDNKLYLEEKLPIPEIGEYEALVKNECCMICNGCLLYTSDAADE